MFDKDTRRAITSIIIIWLMTTVLLIIAFRVRASAQINEATVTQCVAIEEESDWIQ